jgi:hypothetical protein
MVFEEDLETAREILDAGAASPTEDWAGSEPDAPS